jgi:hypothetical protein
MDVRRPISRKGSLLFARSVRLLSKMLARVDRVEGELAAGADGDVSVD